MVDIGQLLPVDQSQALVGTALSPLSGRSCGSSSSEFPLAASMQQRSPGLSSAGTRKGLISTGQSLGLNFVLDLVITSETFVMFPFLVAGSQLPTVCRGAWTSSQTWTVSGLHVPCFAYTVFLHSFLRISCPYLNQLPTVLAIPYCPTPASWMFAFPLWAFLLCFSICS